MNTPGTFFGRRGIVDCMGNESCAFLTVMLRGS